LIWFGLICGRVPRRKYWWDFVSAVAAVVIFGAFVDA
jgi:uncharacterized membrane protein YhaH (DUF805 family)